MTAFKARMRSLAADVTPPVALRAAQRAWRRAHGLGSHNFEGSWPTLNDVPVTRQDDDDPWAASQGSAWRGQLKNPGAALPMVDDTGRLILPLIASQFTGPLSVVDFGGGPGIGLVNLLRYAVGLDWSRLRYVLVETPAMCDMVRSEIAARHGTAVTDIPTALPSPLIVHAASSIQYVADHQTVLTRLAHLAPEFFIIANTPMTDGASYGRQVLNAPHRQIAQWVFNRADFIAGMEKCGYRLTFSVDHGQPLTHKNAPGPSAMASMVFSPHHRGAHLDKL